jgi:2-isopropylmalate synthase
LSRVKLYDTTLRDGAQQEGISYSVTDKIQIIKKLDELGMHYIEGGWPGGNPKDTGLFLKAKSLKLKNARLVAFGSTRHPTAKVGSDKGLKGLIDAGTGAVTIVGKSWDLQAKHVLEVSLQENLNMISESIEYLKSKGLTVFFDAEHFFDGFKLNPEYAIKTVEVARKAGCDCVVLCDTNGGSLPTEIAEAVTKTAREVKVPLGIHVHNDSELAVANSVTAVACGVVHVQGTINGYGERCGNANLCSIIPILKLKMGIDCITEAQLSRLSEVSRYVAEMSNMSLPGNLPFVGASAFAHKAGLHVSGILKWEDSYQHINPDKVGNKARVVVSELSGRGNIVYKAKELGISIPVKGEQAKKLVDQIKLMESLGFKYEDADASFEVLLHRSTPGYKPPFELIDYMVVVEKHRRLPQVGNETQLLAEATVKVRINGEVIHTAAEGNGPVNALDQALRKALIAYYPNVGVIELTDYKVRILEESGGTGSQVRVLVQSSDGKSQWTTVGSSTNIIDASWLALADSMEYWFLKHGAKK